MTIHLKSDPCQSYVWVSCCPSLLLFKTLLLVCMGGLHDIVRTMECICRFPRNGGGLPNFAFYSPSRPIKL